VIAFVEEGFVPERASENTEDKVKNRTIKARKRQTHKESQILRVLTIIRSGRGC
jgi:hypothetical protein